MDIAFIALILAFFVASWRFVRFCASLVPEEEQR